MSDRPAGAALVTALSDRRRNLAAFALVAAAVAVAALSSSSVVRYAGVLTAFSVWMAWFVLTTVDWLQLADF